MKRNELLGGYFYCCQFCIHDGLCELRHCDFMGAPAGEGVDHSLYPGHENIAWHLSAFQLGSSRSQCTGKIRKNNSIFYPLICECGTAIDSPVCQKLTLNDKGKERLILAQEIAKKRGVELSEIKSDDEDLPEINPLYISVIRG